jgi:hypothetical protein
MRSKAIAAERRIRYVDYLHEDESMHIEMFPLIVGSKQVPLILRNGSGVSNPWTQCHTQQSMHYHQLRKEIVDPRSPVLSPLCIHEIHLSWLHDPLTVNLKVLFLKVMVKFQILSKLPQGDRIPVAIYHPGNLLPSIIKVKCGIELADDLNVPIMLKL